MSGRAYTLHMYSLCIILEQTFSKIKPLILLSSQFAQTINTSAIGEFVILEPDWSKT